MDRTPIMPDVDLDRDTQLEWIKYRLGTLIEARFLSGLTLDEEVEYRQLARQERSLLELA